MQELDVVRITFDELTAKGWKLWIDDHPTLKCLPSEKYPRHYLTIGRYIPDLVGFDPNGKTVAIEAKGSKNMHRGIGQTIYYSLGAEKVYFAAEKSLIQEAKFLALRYNFGLIDPEDKTVIVLDPRDVKYPFYEDFSRSIKLLNLGLSDLDTQITSLSRNQPLNYAAITLLFHENDRITKLNVEEKMQINNFMVNSKQEIIRGATILRIYSKN